MRKKDFTYAYASACLLFGALTLGSVTDARADEGMYLFSDPPQAQLREKFGFELTPSWLDHSMKAAVRFNNGGSGGFISPDGLVITNHHIADEALSKLSTPDRDLIANGYLAHSRAEELKAPNLELNCLQSIEDVTARVNGAIKPGMTGDESSRARLAAMAEIEKESLDSTGLRSDVVTLYQGGRFHLYRYKKYTDVRIVWAPEQGIASFGGDVDNFEYPRRALDVAIFRVYENGQPVHPQAYFPVNPKGATEGELVFVVGHPGSTNRLDTLARVEHLRNFTLPYRLARVRSLEAALIQHAERGHEQARQADNDIHSVANSRKAYTGMYQGLLDRSVMERKRSQEQKLRSATNSEEAFAAIASAETKLRSIEEPYALLEKYDGISSPLFKYARHLLRLADELKKPGTQRLREYRDSNLESLYMDLLDESIIYPDVQKARLRASLSFMAERLGADDPDVQLVLQGKSPAVRASELVDNCHLGDVNVRRKLLKGDAQSLAECDDAMIALAKAIDARARHFRNLYESEVREPELEAYGKIANERFRVEGATAPPDATSTLRLSYGVTKGYEADGQQVPWTTVYADAYAVNDAHNGRSPFTLPESWLRARNTINMQTPMVFVATSDTIGGNSGSPVVDKNGSMVGVNFDRNQYGMVRNFVYDEQRARHISVSSASLLTALSQVYGASELIEELTAGAATASQQ